MPLKGINESGLKCQVEFPDVTHFRSLFVAGTIIEVVVPYRLVSGDGLRGQMIIITYPPQASGNRFRKDLSDNLNLMNRLPQ